MRSSAERDLVVAKLENGDDPFARIEDGMVLWAIGMIRDFEVGYRTES